MNVTEILNQKGIRKTEARALIVQAISEGAFSLDSAKQELELLPDKQIATVLEAVEELSRQKGTKLDAGCLRFAKRYLLSANNSCKREASRIVGNMASDYPDELDDAIPALLVNANNDGTVIRWASAYALSRIVVLDLFSGTKLARQVRELCDAEQESGVKNQYVKALKKLR